MTRHWTGRALGTFMIVVGLGACLESDAPSNQAIQATDTRSTNPNVDATSVDTQQPDDAGSEDTSPLPEDVSPPPTEEDVTGPPTPSSGCNAATVSQQRVMREVVVKGVTRQYRLSLPSAPAGQQLPVLMAFQGGDGGDSPFPQQNGFNALVDEASVAVVYPIAKLLPPNEGAWQLNTSPGFRQDIDFVEAIIDDLAQTHCIDTQRIYATGYSLGSMFTYELPCHLSTRFAAIASFAGTMPVNPNSCAFEQTMGIMHIHGRDDWLISYDNRWDWKAWDSVGTMYDIAGLVEYWRAAYNCSETSTPSEGAIYQVIHDSCDGGARVEHYGLQGVAHDWPSTIAGTPTYQVIWNFVSGFAKL